MLDLLKSRRSIRKFKDREVEGDKLDIILKSALLSPSSRGVRPWHFIVVTDKETLQKLSASKQYGSQFLAGAPAGIVVIGDTKASDIWIEDTSIASIIIQLAAQDLGLGSCWIQIRERFKAENQKSEEYVKSVLDIPGEYGVLSIIALGYPDETKKPYDENELENTKLHFDKF
ncbi:MAG TPA: nitroreductase family protein [Ruminiclostridium sp.]|nr:nitroreductase family protein [Ruminiclostridium sp.]